MAFDHFFHYADWQIFFEKHELIEGFHCNHPLHRGKKDELKLGNLKNLTFSIYHRETAVGWEYLKNLSTLRNIKIITDDLDNIQLLAKEILQNLNITGIEIYEETRELEIKMPEDKIAHSRMEIVIKGSFPKRNVIIDSRYTRFENKLRNRN